MTILGSEGFDNGTLRMSAIHYNGNISFSAPGHTGAYALLLGAYVGNIRYSVTGTPANISISVWYDPDTNWVTGTPPIYVYLTTGEAIGFIWDSANKTFDAYVDGVKVADGTIQVLVNDWFHIQIYILIDNAGTINMRIGGQQSIAYSGDTLPVAANAEIEYIYFSQSGGASMYVKIDDLVWGTNEGGYLGDCRVDWLPPTADTAADDWSKSAGGDAYALVDEVPASGADYLYTDTNAQETELELEDWDDTDKTPLLVTSWGRAYEDAATAESLDIGVDSGGVNDVTQYIMTDAYQYYDHVMEQNPDGPAAWNNASIDALLLRINSVI